MSTIPVVSVLGPLSKDVQLMLDTGAEVSVIKLNILPEDCSYNTTKRVALKGIGPEPIITLGTISMRLFGFDRTLHLVSNNFEIPHHGVLGSDFFEDTRAKLDYDSRALMVGEFKVPFFKRDTADEVRKPNYDIFEGEEHYLQYANVKPIITQILRPISIDPMHDDYHIHKAHFGSICTLQAEETAITSKSRIERLVECINVSHLESSEERKIVTDLVTEYEDCFHLDGDEFKGTSMIEHRIKVTEEEPINTKQYRFPYHLKDELNRQVNKMLEEGIIKHSDSPFNSPVWIVPKKADTTGKPRYRIIIDFRELNERTIADNYPIPNIADIFDQVGGAKYYTVLDMHAGFHHVSMHKDSAHYTGFSTDRGHYEFVRMPFGLKNSPATFQRLVNECLLGLQGQGCFSYIDDLVIYSQSLEEHVRIFRQLMTRLRKYNLKLEITKCEFLKPKVHYLGHIISQDGLGVDNKKVEAIKKFPVPKTQKNVREFLGLATYYSRFINNFAKTTKPLTALLQKDTKFTWTDETSIAFETVKKLLSEAPLLAFPDFFKEFLVSTDASNIAVAGILSQGEIGKDRPIAYTSRMLRGAEPRYDTYEKEALAVHFSVKQFRHYLYGRPFKVITDHQPLVWFKKADASVRVQKWRFILAEYQYKIIYRPGRKNAPADALSRNIEGGDASQVTVVTRSTKQNHDTKNQSRRIKLKLPRDRPETSENRLDTVRLSKTVK